MQASDFLERLDDSGRPILSEKFTALLSYANGAHERPVCLEGVSYLEKVISCSCACAATSASRSQNGITKCPLQVTNRELMYATLQAKLKSPGITANACTPPYLKVRGLHCAASSLGMSY